MTGAVIGVIVGVVAVAAWIGGRRAAALPRKSDRAAVLPREFDLGSITFAETDRKVIARVSEDGNFSEKVIASPTGDDGCTVGGESCDRPGCSGRGT